FCARNSARSCGSVVTAVTLATHWAARAALIVSNTTAATSVACAVGSPRPVSAAPRRRDLAIDNGLTGTTRCTLVGRGTVNDHLSAVHNGPGTLLSVRVVPDAGVRAGRRTGRVVAPRL